MLHNPSHSVFRSDSLPFSGSMLEHSRDAIGRGELKEANHRLAGIVLRQPYLELLPRPETGLTRKRRGGPPETNGLTAIAPPGG